MAGLLGSDGNKLGRPNAGYKRRTLHAAFCSSSKPLLRPTRWRVAEAHRLFFLACFKASLTGIISYMICFYCSPQLTHASLSSPLWPAAVANVAIGLSLLLFALHLFLSRKSLKSAAVEAAVDDASDDKGPAGRIGRHVARAGGLVISAYKLTRFAASTVLLILVIISSVQRGWTNLNIVLSEALVSSSISTTRCGLRRLDMSTGTCSYPCRCEHAGIGAHIADIVTAFNIDLARGLCHLCLPRPLALNDLHAPST